VGQGTKVEHCPATCQSLKKISDAHVQVPLGCASVTPKGQRTDRVLRRTGKGGTKPPP
jgi:hypothetical protein